MRKYILILLLLGVTDLSAQEKSINSIQLSWGVGNIMRQDLSVSPFIHKDWSAVNVYLNYSRSKKLEQQVTLKFSLYNPASTESYEFTSFYNGSLTTIPHSFTIVDIDYALGKELFHTAKWSFVLGGKSRNFVYASDYNFGDSGPSPMVISFGLDAWIRASYQLNEKNYFASNVSIPVFSYVYRNPYLVQDDEYMEIIYAHNGLKELGSRIAAGELRSWGNAQRIEFKINYGYVINQRWDIGVDYLFSMNFNQNPTKFAQFENIFFVGGKFKF